MSDDSRRERSVARCRRWSGRFSVGLVRDVGRAPPRTVVAPARSIGAGLVGQVLGGVGAGCRTGAAENLCPSVLGGVGAGCRTRAAEIVGWSGGAPASVGRASSRWGWCGMSDGSRREPWSRRVLSSLRGRRGRARLRRVGRRVRGEPIRPSRRRDPERAGPHVGCAPSGAPPGPSRPRRRSRR